jgi:hypothetical protein
MDFSKYACLMKTFYLRDRSGYFRAVVLLSKTIAATSVKGRKLIEIVRVAATLRSPY